MPRKRRHNATLFEQEQQEQKLFAKVAEFFDVPITHVRRVCYRFHNGEHLTVRYAWQVRDGDEWRAREEWPPTEPVTGFPGWKPG